jgi:plastocyanin
MRVLYAISIISFLLVPVFSAIHMVTIKDFSFKPQEVDIMPGDQVTWTNNDGVDHTVTSDDGSSFASSNLAQGQSFSLTFMTAATLPYHCSIHPFMLGTVKAAS